MRTREFTSMVVLPARRPRCSRGPSVRLAFKTMDCGYPIWGEHWHPETGFSIPCDLNPHLPEWGANKQKWPPKAERAKIKPPPLPAGVIEVPTPLPLRTAKLMKSGWVGTLQLAPV